MESMFVSSWFTLARTAIVGGLAYIALLAFLRVSGRRTLSKMNAFDLVLTVALGSTLATIILDAGVALAQGVVALCLLIVLQFAITWSSVRWQWVRHVVTGEPSLLFHRGQYLPGALRRARVTEQEVRAAGRGDGHTTLAEVEAVVLETDGSFSVLSRRAGGESLLFDVRR